MRNNGGYIGVSNIPTTTVASGMWQPSFIAAQNTGYPYTDNYWPTAKDPNFSSVVFLCHFQQSGTANGPSIVANGAYVRTPASITGQTGLCLGGRFGTRCAQVGNLTGNAFVAIDPGSSFTLGTGDFTIEGWFQTSSGGSQMLIDFRQHTFTAVAPAIFISNVLNLYVNGSTVRSGGTTITLAAWHHWAMSRVSGSSYLYLDGVQQGATYTDGNNYIASSLVTMGAAYDTATYGTQLIGIFDEYRITKGVGRYSGSTCTVPTAPFPDY